MIDLELHTRGFFSEIDPYDTLKTFPQRLIKECTGTVLVSCFVGIGRTNYLTKLLLRNNILTANSNIKPCSVLELIDAIKNKNFACTEGGIFFPSVAPSAFQTLLVAARANDEAQFVKDLLLPNIPRLPGLQKVVIVNMTETDTVDFSKS